MDIPATLRAIADCVEARDNRRAPVTTLALSDRDRTLLVFIAKGLSDREIGALMGLTHHTVRDHVRKLCRTLEVDRRVEAAVWAAKQGLV
jgi:two-component system, NarL family, nitrate/nitrite response regulator NarL